MYSVTWLIVVQELQFSVSDTLIQQKLMPYQCQKIYSK